MMLHNNQRPDSPCRFISEMYKNTTPTAEGCALSKGHSVVPQYIFCSCHLDQILKDNHNVAVGLLPNTLSFPYNVQEILLYNPWFTIEMEKPHDRHSNLGNKV